MAYWYLLLEIIREFVPIIIIHQFFLSFLKSTEQLLTDHYLTFLVCQLLTNSLTKLVICFVSRYLRILFIVIIIIYIYLCMLEKKRFHNILGCISRSCLPLCCCGSLYKCRYCCCTFLHYRCSCIQCIFHLQHLVGRRNKSRHICQ